MKLTAVFLLAACLSANAGALAQKVDLSEKNAPLERVFKTIRQQTGYTFVYRGALLKNAPGVTLNVRNMPLEQVLDRCLQNTRLAYSIVNKMIIIKEKEVALPEIPAILSPEVVLIPIRGKVANDKGEPLAGATVSEKGTNKYATTAEDGTFLIEATDANAILTISYVGYETMEVAVGSRSEINIVLLQVNSSITDVVVIGYGTQRKTNLTNAVSTIKAKDIENQITKNPLEAMAGQMAGVSIQQASGKPGANPVVRIRGNGSISAGNSPLYVVDGMPLEDASAFNSINPNDIESIDVLKDAASAAIYGSRGGNGVVLITTKNGKTSKASINFNYYRGFQQVSNKIDMLNRDQYIRFAKDGANLNWANAGGDPSVPNGQRNLNGVTQPYNYPTDYDTNPEGVPDTDWQDEIYQKGPISNYQLSAQGGTEKVRYYVSGNYFTQDGIVKATDFKRYAARINLDADVTSYFRVGVNLSPTYSKENQRQTDGHFTSAGGSALALALLMQPTIQPRYPGGLYGQVFGNPEYLNTILAGMWTPLQPLEDPKFINYGETIRLLGATYAELEPIKNLKIRTTFGSNLSNYTNNFYRPSTVTTDANPALTPGQPNPVISNIASSNLHLQSINYSWENTATYEKQAGEHFFSVLAGYSAQKTTSETMNTNGQAGTFSNDNVTYITGASVIMGGGNKEQWSLLSYLARVNYSYKDKYLLTASVRRDGSSRFGANEKWAVFPSASIGWRISNEPFMDHVGFLNDLKLRVSHGVTGNFNIGNYRSQALLARDNYNFGVGNGTLITGFAPGNFGNPDLTWETNRQTDLGLDIAILQSRVAFSFDFYHRITDGLLYSFPMPSITGFTSSFGNVGRIQNRGFEFELKTVNSTRELKWSTSLNLSINRNKVLKLGLKDEPITALTFGTITQITEVGKPFAQFYGYKTDGIFMNQKDLDDHPEMRFNNTVKPGDIKFVDVDGDGEITPDDRTILGSPHPDFVYGMTNHFSWKGFDLDIQLQGVQGGKVFYLTSRHTGVLNPTINALAADANYWRSEAEPGDGNTPRIGAVQAGLHAVNKYLQDGSYLRIRNVTLGYNLPATLTRKAYLNSVRIYATGQNLFTFTKYVGSNPEVSWNENGESVTAPAVDYGVYPLARTICFGINIGL